MAQPGVQAAPGAQGQPITMPITITRGMVLNESATADAFALFDEPTSGKPSRGWEPGFGSLAYPLHAWVDLGRPYKLSKVSLYDSNGTGSVTISTGRPFAWHAEFEDKLENYNIWNEHALNVESQFVRIEIAEPSGHVPEIKIFGTPTNKPPVMSPAVEGRNEGLLPRIRKPTMDRFIGMNGFIDDPIQVLSAGGWVREYHSWAWDAGDGKDGYKGFPNNQNQFSPAAGGGGGWFFDDYYAKLKAAGIEPAPVMQNSVVWLGGDRSKAGRRAQEAGADSEDPRSYRAHADHMFQFAARYGSRKVDDSLLKLAPDQPRKSGLGLIKYFENWNEADKWWDGRSSYFSPYELAAMSSADRDGHNGALGHTFGILSADPSARLVMSGMARPSLDYLRAMKAWSDWNRPDLKGVNGGFVADAINIHFYSTNGSDQTQGSVGLSPEAGKIQDLARSFVEYRDKYLPGVEVWMTEFGYDTNPASPFRAPSIGPNSNEEVQGQWLVRSYLELAAAGLDRAAMFMSRDDAPRNSDKFASSGLVTQKGEENPKPSWFYIATLKSRLSGMSFKSELDQKRADVKAVLFQNPKTNARAVALWCPTSEAKVIGKYVLALPMNTRKATLIEMKSGERNGVETPLAVAKGTVQVLVSERPILILCS